MTARLGRLQKAALTRLAGVQDGLTATDLAPLSSLHSLQVSLRLLGSKGLAEITGVAPPLSEDRRGAPSNVWSITDKGREALAGVTR